VGAGGEQQQATILAQIGMRGPVASIATAKTLAIFRLRQQVFWLQRFLLGGVHPARLPQSPQVRGSIDAFF
jgi:hypothetical protein